MSGVQKGGVAETPQKDIKNDVDRNRSFSDHTEREFDIRELKHHYEECLCCLEDGECYSDDIFNLQDYIGYCLGRKITIIPEGRIPKRARIGDAEYAECVGEITDFLSITHLLAEMSEYGHEDVRCNSFYDHAYRSS